MKHNKTLQKPFFPAASTLPQMTTAEVNAVHLQLTVFAYLDFQVKAEVVIYK